MIAGHRRDLEGFKVDQALYEEVRPDYPSELLAVLEELGVGLINLPILDVATGTGKLMRLLQGGNGSVIGLDLSLPMLTVARRQADEGHFVQAIAENLPVRTGAFALVTCGQGFHWLVPGEALKEFRRALPVGGFLLLVWNRRLRASKLEQEIESSIRAFRSDGPVLEPEEWKRSIEFSLYFDQPVTREIVWTREVPAKLLVNLVLSRSYIARQRPRTRSRIYNRLSEMVREAPEGQAGHLRLSYSCGIILSRAR